MKLMRRWMTGQKGLAADTNGPVLSLAAAQELPEDAKVVSLVLPRRQELLPAAGLTAWPRGIRRRGADQGGRRARPRRVVPALITLTTTFGFLWGLRLIHPFRVVLAAVSRHSAAPG